MAVSFFPNARRLDVSGQLSQVLPTLTRDHKSHKGKNKDPEGGPSGSETQRRAFHRAP
jgi:hypothetical protein